MTDPTTPDPWLVKAQGIARTWLEDHAHLHPALTLDDVIGSLAYALARALRAAAESRGRVAQAWLQEAHDRLNALRVGNIEHVITVRIDTLAAERDAAKAEIARLREATPPLPDAVREALTLCLERFDYESAPRHCAGCDQVLMDEDGEPRDAEGHHDNCPRERVRQILARLDAATGGKA